MGMKDRFRADRDFIDGVLNDADDMVVALNDGDGAPYAFPVNFVLLGTGLAVCDGQEEPLEPGVCHICKKGSEHSIQNTGEGDLVLLTLVVERGEGRENDT